MDTSRVQLTKQGYEELAEELSRLTDEKRPATVERVARAREFGDLSENAEYQAAREELNFIDGRIEELSDIMSRAKVVINQSSNKTVELGCKVTVNSNGISRLYHVVGEWEANPAEMKISSDSPLGKALLGKKTGDKVEVKAPAGTVIYTIKKIH
jgi:transcription elongation factor GreA